MDEAVWPPTGALVQGQLSLRTRTSGPSSSLTADLLALTVGRTALLITHDLGGLDEGGERYRGSLRVAERPSGSEVHLHVAIPDDRLGPSPDSAVAEIQRGIEEAFDRLSGLIAT